MAGHGRKNTDGALVAALAGGSTVADAARLARVGETTVYRRLRDPDFKKAVVDARSEMLSRAVGTLADASTEAATTLRRLLDAQSESVQLGAARSLLEVAVKLRESEELEQRIAALEEAMADEAGR